LRKWAKKHSAANAPPTSDQRDIVERLRDTPNWRRETWGPWKDMTSHYDRAPFDAADEIERLRITSDQELADTPTPKAQSGTWTLIAPDGRQWQTDSPLKCCALELRERVPAEVALSRIFRELEAQSPSEQTPTTLQDKLDALPPGRLAKVEARAAELIEEQRPSNQRLAEAERLLLKFHTGGPAAIAELIDEVPAFLGIYPLPAPDESGVCPSCGEGPSAHYEGECVRATDTSNPPCARCESYAEQIVALALEAEQLDKRLLAIRNRFDPLNESGLFSIADVASVSTPDGDKA
jgi:hypothetical protein